MKKGILLILLKILVEWIPVHGQVNPPNKLSKHFHLSDLHLTLSNNFITSQYPYTPTYISLPFREEYFTAYGEHLLLTAVRSDSLVSLGDYSGEFFIDSSRQDQQAFPLNRLQVRVSLNNTILRNWRLLEQCPSFRDTAVHYKPDPTRIILSYHLLDDRLNIGDSILIELRKDTTAPFMKLHVKRKNGRTQPFMMMFRQDTSMATTTVSFISKELLFRADEQRSHLFYADWPGSGLHLQHQLMPQQARLAFYFRKEHRNNTDSSLAYRLLSNRHADTTWQRTDGQVLISALQPGTSYQLEVKYADGSGQTSVYTFYTPALWYQTTWFKVFTGILAICLLLLVLFISSTRKNKRALKQRHLEMQALYAQMNPHFLFNALGSIQGLMNDMQTAKANKYLTGFATLLRSTISLGRRELIPLSLELKNLDNYIALERLRFGFDYQLQVAPGIQTDEIDVPPMLAQPLIENAAKHALSGLRDQGRLTLEVKKEGTDLVLLILDNGSGFDPGKVQPGHGISLTQERIALFNRMYRHRKIALTFMPAGIGTCCCLRFKNWTDRG